jgi:hypothetical protein
MSYIVTKTDGTVLTTIIDGTKDDSSSSLTLLGRNYSNYGQFVANDFIQILENFSFETAPVNPLTGQIWWKRDTNILQVYNGTTWKVVGNAKSTASAPPTTTAGDIWWDSVNQQLYIYNGTTPYSTAGWKLVGPAFSATNGKSGGIWEEIADSLGSYHHVLSIYLDSVRTGIISSDSLFTPNVAIAGFTTIQTGYNIRTNDTFWGTAQNSNLLNNILPSKFFRNDIDNITSGNIVIANNSGLRIGTTQQLRVTLTGSDASITNTAFNGDINLYVNVGGVSTRIIYVEGTTGAIEVAENPTTNLGIATKQYVDAKMVDSVLTGNPVAPTPSAGDNDTSIATTAFVYAANVAMQSYIESIKSTKANIASPIFTGNPVAPTPSAGDNDTSIATTAFVYSANVAMQSYVDSVDILKANIASPIFTGNPQSVTPSAGDNDTSIATTAFVYAANVAMKSYVDSVDILKATLVSPAFTGNPTAPTMLAGTANTAIATTAFVYAANIAMQGYVDLSISTSESELQFKANIDSPSLTGIPRSPTMATGTANTAIATTEFVNSANIAMQGYVDAADAINDSNTNLKANIANPTFTGVPKAPTMATGTANTSIATTAFVNSANVAIKGYIDAADAINDSNTNLKANIANPTFTGVPKAPTMAAGTANTSIATTAFVMNNSGFEKNRIYEGNSSFLIDDLGAGAAVLTIDGTEVLTASSVGAFLKQGSTAYTQAAGTNNTTIATTAFVQTATLKWSGSTKYVSTSAPSGGVNGDIWFRYT